MGGKRGRAEGGRGSTPEQFSGAEEEKKKIRVLLTSLPTLSMDSGENN